MVNKKDNQLKRERSEHTPTPWNIFQNNQIRGNDGVFIADGANPYQRETAIANIAFIVRAVNSHEALVEVLKKVDNAINQPEGYISVGLWLEIKKAITQAEGR